MSSWCGCVLSLLACILCRFISKYHPTTLRKQKDENEANLKKRLDAFQFLLGSGRLDNVPLSTDCTDKVIKVMDTGKLWGRGISVRTSSLHCVCSHVT